MEFVFVCLGIAVVCFIAFAIWYFAYYKNHVVYDGKEEKVDSKDKMAVLFYEECKNRNITSLSDSKDIETALNILKYNEKFSNLPHNTEFVNQLFLQGKTAVEGISQRRLDEANEIENKKQEEELRRREMLGEDGYKVIQAARNNIIPDELFSGTLKYVADIFMNDVKEIKDGYHYIYVFKGKTDYYSYIPDTDTLTNGLPNIYRKRMYDETYTKLPDKLVYTSATVGGITTGGVDVVKGNYQRNVHETGKYCVFIGYGSMRQVHNIINNMWCDDEILKYLEYNGANILRTNKPVYGAENQIPKIQVASHRTLVIGEVDKSYCDILIKAMER